MKDAFPRAIIFDWDNTLIDNWVSIAAALNDTFDKFGHEAWTIDEIRKRCARPSLEVFPEWFGGDWRSAYEFFYNRFGEIHADGLHALPGADTLLRWLQEQNVPVFVISSKRGDYLRKQVTTLGWDGLFSATVGSQDAPRDKPARESVEFALKAKKMSPDADIWFVGDGALDMQCAQNSGCTPVFLGATEEAARLYVARAFTNCHDLRAYLYNQTQGR